MRSEMSMNAAVEPPTVDLHAGAGDCGRDHVATQPGDEVARRRRPGATTWAAPGSPRCSRPGSCRGAPTAATSGSASPTAATTGRSAAAPPEGTSATSEQRAVEALAEARAEQVVGPALGRRRRERSRVGLAEPHRQRRRGEREQDDEAGDQVAPRAVARRASAQRTHMPWRTRSGCISASTWLRFTQGSRRLLIFVPGEPEQRGEQRDRGDAPRPRRRPRSAKPIVVTVGMPGDDEPADRDHDGGPREHDRHARGAVGVTGGFGDGHPGRELLAVAGDDEQRVVDADAEPDHRGDRRGDLGDVEEVREDGDRRQPDARGRRARCRSARPSRRPSRTRSAGRSSRR